MPDEQWKDIEEYEGYYQVSDRGRVRSLDRDAHHGPHGGTKRVKGRMLSTRGRAGRPDGGYPTVSLHKEGEMNSRYVHHLVARAFIGECPDGHQINHKNGIKADNRLENIEYVTPAENMQHAHDNGLIVAARGEDAGMSKLTRGQVMAIRRKAASGTARLSDLAQEYEIGKEAIRAIINGRTWTHLPVLGKKWQTLGVALTGIEVEEIRTRYAEGDITQAALADEFGVHYSTISLIVNNKRWHPAAAKGGK